MRYLVIGLGKFGTALAKELSNMGNEVIAVDIKDKNIENIKNNVSAAYIMDTTDENVITALPLSELDITVVAIGEDLAASLRTVVNLQQNGVSNIYARAFDHIHYSILNAIGNLKILTPELDAAKICASALK